MSETLKTARTSPSTSTDCSFRPEPVCYIISGDRLRPRYTTPFHFYGHARIVLRPTYVSFSRRSRHASQTGSFTRAHFFSRPECSTNVVVRVMEVAELVVKKPAWREEAADESSLVVFRTGDSSAHWRQPALILWVMHFAIVYFIM